MLQPGKSATQDIRVTVDGSDGCPPLTIECGPRTAYVHDAKARAIFRRAGVTQYMKAPHRRGVWMCPSSAIWNVIAFVEKVQGREVNLVEVAR